MREALLLVCALMVLVAALPARGARPEIKIPADFPTFTVPGQEQAMAELRELYWVHYERGGPLATLWDEWEISPTLWPAVTTDNRLEIIRRRWREALLGRGMDAEGYVFTHQHGSIAHQQGWPFPFWGQGKGWGRHFSTQGYPSGWGPREPDSQAGWETGGLRDLGVKDEAWRLELTERGAWVATPEFKVEPVDAPFIQVRWTAQGLEGANPRLQWETREQPGFSPARQMYLPPAGPEGFTFTMIPVYRHPEWKGTITRLRLCFDNTGPAQVGIQAFFTQYDTRHTINNQNFVRGSIHYFNWTGDVDFLRLNLQRMRLAMRYLMDDLGGRRYKCIVCPWVGHDGRSGLVVREGKKEQRSGLGIGNNYWDLLPMGYKDAYATIQYYSALLAMAGLEREIARHPEWNLPGGPLALDAKDLERHAAEVKANNRVFWNQATGRFTAGPDIEGKSADYGFVFLNLEALYYDFATPEQAQQIMDWISGKRTVAGDTSTGRDIYHWRFGPRATTKRNEDYYLWAWSSPESIPWGGQVQDGGGVLGFSFHDLMARLRVLGPDDCWARVQEIVAWYREVQEAGGPREYYKDGTRGTLQGGGTAGGLGIDQEFFESILVPQVITEGFLGLRPRVDGLAFSPRLPAAWPSLGVTGIHWHDLVLDAEATNTTLTLTAREGRDTETRIVLPGKGWRAEVTYRNGTTVERTGEAEGSGTAFPVNWEAAERAVFRKRG